ncbi:Disease resistance protein [Actinidia chinensis var. chinensis]|uniref:Disease resistance protein n=1 Tax=Actinidia chinensis var. chinensis TaxID=1590841 RepID=A0A2R6PI99_ACTCC|nr:Disease resistance protein [Actinidia chinensis var. chinensis]
MLYLAGHLQHLPRWIPSAFNLVKVCLWYSKLRDADPLQSLQDLPNLVTLEIIHGYGGEELWFKAGAFQNLETLYLAALKELIWVRVEARSMPRLKKLFLVDCKLMKELPSGMEHLTNLERLDLLDMSYSLISRLDRALQGGDYWKVAHIPDVWVGGLKDGHFEVSLLS